uniref:Circadian associated repressor of transcription n=1 Tax=Latimeria chalumnae TaxID=7897 RepID=H3AS79_LATCH
VQNEEEKEKKRDLLNTEQETEFRTKGDQIFAQKCHELRDFVKPLMDLLNGLKTGRYEKGLSSFQQSVAMDRIQRIVGVLQNPWMGERYLGTLLQVEMMLKVWFPHVARKTPVLCETGPEDNKPQMLKHPARNSSSAASYKSEPGSESPGLETPHSLENSSVLKLTWMHTSPICIPLQASLG